MSETEKRTSNYDVAKIRARESFLGYDQEEMIRKFSLVHDADYLYIRFVGRDYKVGRRDGSVTWTDAKHSDSMDANFNEVMTIYDVLCYAWPDCRLSGEFVNMKSLSSIQGGNPGGNLFDRWERRMDHKDAGLAGACERLGGVRAGKGDVAYQLPMFDFLPVRVQFWNSDDEFPASLQLFLDKNVLQYMHFETVAFAATHLVSRLAAEMDDVEAKQ